MDDKDFNNEFWEELLKEFSHPKNEIVVEFKIEFKKRILDNKEALKELSEIMASYISLPNIDVVRTSLSEEILQVFNKYF